ncbi:MAG: bifunctional diaminohydroxyphosphoribosylaminopyrimidine deaminase/5-amino-6-(5-phosphoribosylamino)uracil reductase RibD [Myxococcota bacterium]
MRVAVRRAMRAVGRTRPNPCVGAVVARDGRIISVGHHVRAGEPHGEINALRAAGEAARGADLYVTLEPCSHHGRTPPCADAVIAAGVGRVFVATRDLNPRVSGRGVEKVRAAGIPVVEGLCQAQAQAVLEPFFTWVTTGRPLVVLKAATSLDGRIATSTGDSRGLSGKAAHAWLHRLRDRVDAILVGVGTVLADNPRLTPRRPPIRGKGPQRLVRVVLDSSLRTPVTAALFEDVSQHPLRIFCAPDAPEDARLALEARGAVVRRVQRGAGGLDLEAVWVELGREGVTSVLVEGGAGIHGSVLESRTADRVALVVAPRLLGERGVPLTHWQGPAHLAQGIRIERVKLRKLGEDALFEGLVRYP